MLRIAKIGRSKGRREGRLCRWWVLVFALCILSGTGRAATASAADEVAADWTELHVAVLDRLSRTDDEDPTRAANAYRQLSGRLLTLAKAGAGARAPEADTARLVAMRGHLEDYWRSFNGVLDLRGQRDRLNDGALRPISIDIRMRLQRVIGGGKATEAGIAGDAVISVLLAQHHVDHYVGRHDGEDIRRVHLELEAARRRLEELGRLALEPGVRAVVSEVGGLIGAYETAFAQLVTAVTEESRLMSELADFTGVDTKHPSGAVIGATGMAILPKVAEAESGIVGPVGFGAVSVIAALLIGLGVGWLMARRNRRSSEEQDQALEGVLGERPADSASDRGDHETATYPVDTPSLDAHSVNAHKIGSVLVQAAPTVPDIVKADDWLGGIGRSVAMLHANAGELARLRALSECLPAGLSAEAVAELIEARSVAESRNAAMTGFLKRVGEQLRGPLEAIVCRGDHLMIELDRHRISHLGADVEVIQWTGEQVLRVVEALGAQAEIESGELEVVPENFSVDHLVTELRERLRPMINLYGNRLNIQTAPGLGVMHTDFTKVRTALLHLLENACKFTENGDVTLVVMRVAEGGCPQLRFTVTDTGIGIAAKHIDQIFEPFVSFTSGHTRSTGLGLTLVHHYATRLGGKVVVDSTLGLGSCFVLTIPAMFQELTSAPNSRALPGDARALELSGPQANVSVGAG